MSTHCHRCIIHPQHNNVGVCGLCVRERLVALVDESSVDEGKRCACSPASGTASASADGPYHSFSSSSAREHHIQLLSPPAAPPAEPVSGSELPIHLPPATTSLLQKLKLKANFISIPPSPDHAFFKNAASSSPTVYRQKNKLSLPFKSRKSSVSELTEGLYMHSKVAPETGDDQVSASTVGQRKPSLMTLFHQSEVAPDTTNLTTLEGSEKPNYAPSEERRRRIEQFSAAMRSPGFALSSTKAAALSDYRQTYTAEYLADYGDRAPVCGSAEQSSNSTSSSWIVSLFQRKKRRATSKSKSKAIVSEASLVNEVLEEANSARNSVHYASVSEDSGGITPTLKQVIRSRVQNGEAANIQTNEAGANPRYTQGWPVPVDSEQLDAKLEPVTGSTAKMGINNNKHYMDDHEAHVSEEVRHFPRSRSWGRAWNRTPSSQFFTASPQHQLLGSSKQHLNNNNVKLSSLHQHQHHYLTSTPKHPALDAAGPKDSRLAIGFYFGPFRRSKRQGIKQS